jgi:hypothetical protein
MPSNIISQILTFPHETLCIWWRFDRNYKNMKQIWCSDFIYWTFYILFLQELAIKSIMFLGMNYVSVCHLTEVKLFEMCWFWCVMTSHGIDNTVCLLYSTSNLHMSFELFIGLLGYHSTAVLVSSAAFLLQRASTDGHLVALVRLVTGGICNSSSASQFEQVCIKLKCIYVCIKQITPARCVLI